MKRSFILFLSRQRPPRCGDAEPSAGGDPAGSGEVQASHGEGDLRAAGGAGEHHEGQGQGERGLGQPRGGKLATAIIQLTPDDKWHNSYSIHNKFIFRLLLIAFSWELPPLVKKFAEKLEYSANPGRGITQPSLNPLAEFYCKFRFSGDAWGINAPP